MKILKIALVFAVTFVTWFAIAFCRAGWTIPMNKGLSILRNVHKSWVIDGAPENLDLNRYTNTTNMSGRIFVFTNQYVIHNGNYTSLFALELDGFRKWGFMAVTREGYVLWIDKEKGTRILSKEK